MPAGRPRTIKPEDRSPALAYYYGDPKTHIRKVVARADSIRDNSNLPKFLWYRITQIKSRAKLAGLAFDLDQEWLDQQPQYCAITGAQFNILPKGWGPQTPSFDRINPSLGYLKTNTRIVCHWVNMAKRDWPDEQIQQLICSAADHIRSSKAPPVEL